MRERLDKYIKQHNLFSKGDKLILAISGGTDSVALAYLLKQLEYDFTMAHCNFGLRNKESDADEVFVKKLAKKLGVKCFTKSFKTTGILFSRSALYYGNQIRIGKIKSCRMPLLYAFAGNLL